MALVVPRLVSIQYDGTNAQEIVDAVVNEPIFFFVSSTEENGILTVVLDGGYQPYVEWTWNVGDWTVTDPESGGASRPYTPAEYAVNWAAVDESV